MSKKAKLHQLLSVERSVKNTAASIFNEAAKTFEKAEHFTGRVVKYFPFRDEDSKDSDILSEEKRLTTTVGHKLHYVFASIKDSIDIEFQKDLTNRQSKADIVVNGTTIASDVPGTTLLYLEGELKKIRDLFIKIPTLTPGIYWEVDPNLGDNIYKTKNANTKYRTRKETIYITTAPATEKHPAQVVAEVKDVNIGYFEETLYSGMISPAEKSAYLRKIDQLLIAVKKARSEANDVELVTATIAESISDFIMS